MVVARVGLRQPGHRLSPRTPHRCQTCPWRGAWAYWATSCGCGYPRRPFPAELITSELEHAMNAHRELMLLVGDIVTGALWRPVMCPALDDYPRTKDQVTAQLRVVREACLADQPDRDATQDSLEDYVLYNLQEPEYRRIVEEMDPELASLIRSVMKK
jgi:hypothetical protein